jgi:hypothetical protein
MQSLEHALRDVLDLGTRQCLPVGLGQEVAIKVL